MGKPTNELTKAEIVAIIKTFPGTFDMECATPTEVLKVRVYVFGVLFLMSAPQ
jgi:hypothetical protein